MIGFDDIISIVIRRLELFLFCFTNEIPASEITLKNILVSCRVYLSCATTQSELNMAVESISRQNMYLCALVLLVIISANLVQSEFFNNVIQCSGKKTCSECIQTRGCAWCAQPDFNNRCFQNNTSPLTGSCQEPYIFSPSNDLKIIQAQELTRRVESIGGGGGGGYEEDLYQQHQSKGSHYHGGYEQELHTQSKQTQYSGSHRQVSESVKYGYHEESGRIVQIYPQVVDLKLRLSKTKIYPISKLNFY